jgi:hypothetical protein
MASGSKERSTFTLDQVTVWREDLFDNRSLRISVEKLSEWPLGHYLWAAVLQAAHLDRVRQQAPQQHWQTPAWDLGRFAKAHPLLFKLDENRALAKIKNSIGGQFWKDYLHMDTADADGLRRCLGRMPRCPGVRSSHHRDSRSKAICCRGGRQCSGRLRSLLEDCAVFATTVTKFVLHAPLS